MELSIHRDFRQDEGKRRRGLYNVDEADSRTQADRQGTGAEEEEGEMHYPVSVFIATSEPWRSS